MSPAVDDVGLGAHEVLQLGAERLRVGLVPAAGPTSHRG